jgi:tRNA A-37 threonylcarbamoyl transferase component Bud32/DNA-binding transcriptional ArsR family regulator
VRAPAVACRQHAITVGAAAAGGDRRNFTAAAPPRSLASRVLMAASSDRDVRGPESIMRNHLRALTSPIPTVEGWSLTAAELTARAPAGGVPIDAGRFVLRRRLGSGGSGVVYEAFDHQLRSRVAIKLLREMDSGSLVRFKQEFRILQGVEHPNLVSLGELIEHRGRWFFTMELVEGVDLIRYVRRGPDGSIGEADTVPADGAGPPPLRPQFHEPRLRTTLIQLVRGLAALHGAGKVHRDVKPSNVLVTTDGRAVVVDFGLVTTAEPTTELSVDDGIAGTALYMAPETPLAGPPAPAADWYGMGVVLYEALTGRLPHDGDSTLEILYSKQHQIPPAPRTLTQGIPDDLDRLCVRLLDPDPARRPGADEILDSLGAAGPAPATAPPRRRERLFVGRDEELRRLADAFIETRRERARSVLVRGAPGVGKTALIRHFLDQALAEFPKAVILSGRCHAREWVPYNVLDGMVDALVRYLQRLPVDELRTVMPCHAALLPRVFPVLGEVTSNMTFVLRGDDQADDLRQRAFAALRELLMRLAALHPVVIVIDDVQWADADGRQLLHQVLGPPHSPPILLVCAQRSEAPAAVLPGEHETIELAALPDEQARELAAQALAPVVRGPYLDPSWIARAAAGHPRYLDELVGHLARHPEAARRPLRVEDAIAARIGRLDDAARQLLQLVAVADARMSRSALAAAAGLDVPTANRHLTVLEHGHLVQVTRRTGGYRYLPYDALVARAVAATLDDTQRTRHHDRLASVLSKIPGVAPELVLRHLQAAGRTGQAAVFAIDAARRARAAGAHGRAAELYRAALRLHGHDAATSRKLEAALGDALIRAGAGAIAAQHLLAAADGADPAAALDLRQRAAEHLLRCGHVERAVELIAPLLRELGDPLPESPRQAARSLRRRQRRAPAWPPRRPVPMSAPVDMARRMAITTSAIDTVVGAAAAARAAERALATGDGTQAALAAALHASCLALAGQPAAAVRWAEIARTAAPAPGLHVAGWLRAMDGALAYAAGTFVDAAMHLGAADDLLGRHAIGAWERDQCRRLRLWSLRAAGAWSELRLLRDAWSRQATAAADRRGEVSLRRATSILHLVDDTPDQARIDLDADAVLPPASSNPEYGYHLIARAELALYDGSAGDAWRELEPALAAMCAVPTGQPPPLAAHAGWTRGRLALAGLAHTLQPRPLLRLIRQRVIELEAAPPGPAHVHAALLRAALDAADDTRAQAALGRALALAAQHGMELELAAARYRLGELVGGGAGERLMATARDTLSAQGAVAPDALIAMVAPMPCAERWYPYRPVSTRETPPPAR